MKDFYLTTETHRKSQSDYVQRNHEVVLEKNRDYKRRNREKISAYNKRYAMTHDRTEYYRQYNLKRKQKRLAENG